MYSAATMGATVHLHYCMDKFVGWTLLHGEGDNECGNCGMKEKKGGCCKDEHKQIKVDTDHQKSSVLKYNLLFEGPALVTAFASYEFKTIIPSFCTPLSNAPLISLKRLHLLNCVFLI